MDDEIGSEAVLAKADEFRVEMDSDGMVHFLDGEDTVRLSMDFATWETLLHDAAVRRRID